MDQKLRLEYSFDILNSNGSKEREEAKKQAKQLKKAFESVIKSLEEHRERAETGIIGES